MYAKAFYIVMFWSMSSDCTFRRLVDTTPVFLNQWNYMQQYTCPHILPEKNFNLHMWIQRIKSLHEKNTSKRSIWIWRLKMPYQDEWLIHICR